MVCVLAVGSSACLKPIMGRPAWVVGRQHRDFPVERFLVGIGTGESPTQAAEEAKQDLVESLQDIVRQELELRAPRSTTSGFAAVRPSALEALAGQPAGLRIGVAWSSSDGLRHAAMAIIDRAEIASAATEQISAWEQQCDKVFSVALAKQAKEPYTALVNLLSGLLLKAQAEEQRALLAAVRPGPPPVSVGPSLGRLVDTVRLGAEALRLTAARGNGLAVRADSKSVALVLGVDQVFGKRRSPVANLPIRFNPPAGKPMSARTDLAGMATGLLPEVSPFAGSRFKVEAHVDGTQVLAEAGIEPGDNRFFSIQAILERPLAIFNLHATAEGAGKLALVIAETVDGQFRSNSKLVAQLTRDFTEAGYHVVDLDELKIELPAEPTPETMAKAVAGPTDFLVYGVVAAEVEHKVAAGLVFSRARAQILAIKVSGAKLLTKLTPDAKSPGRDAQSAADRALTSLGRTVFQKLTAAMAAPQATGK